MAGIFNAVDRMAGGSALGHTRSAMPIGTDSLAASRAATPTPSDIVTGTAYDTTSVSITSTADGPGGSTVLDADGIAIGGDANAGLGAVGIGTDADALTRLSIVLGDGVANTAGSIPGGDGQSAVVIGTGAGGMVGTQSVQVGAFAHAGGEFSGAFGLNTDVDDAADGGWAIGTDSVGDGAQCTTADDFVIGTALHTVRISGKLRIDTASQTTVGAAGGASALPATPSRYIKITADNGTEYVVPAYAVS